MGPYGAPFGTPFRLEPTCTPLGQMHDNFALRAVPEVEFVVAEGEADEVRVAVVLAAGGGGRQLQVADRAVLAGLGLEDW